MPRPGGSLPAWRRRYLGRTLRPEAGSASDRPSRSRRSGPSDGPKSFNRRMYIIGTKRLYSALAAQLSKKVRHGLADCAGILHGRQVAGPGDLDEPSLRDRVGDGSHFLGR
jgi:hypothetical protein